MRTVVAGKAHAVSQSLSNAGSNFRNDSVAMLSESPGVSLMALAGGFGLWVDCVNENGRVEFRHI
jgi:hypothetical protein